MSRRQQKLEKKRIQILWKFFDDGVWDFYFGLVAVWLGIIIRLGWPAIGLLVMIPMVALPMWLKQKFTFPHISQIKISAPKRKGVLGMVLFFVVVIIGLIFILKDHPGINGFFVYIAQNALVIGAFGFGAFTWVTAYALGYRRLHLYGVLIFAALFLDAWLFAAQPIGLAFFSGLIIIGSAASVFVQFLQTMKIK